MKDKFVNIFWCIYRFIKGMRYWHREIMYAYQRIRFGISIKDTWSLDYYLLKVIDIGLAELINRHLGCPGDLFTEENKGYECQKWEDILTEMREGFQAGMSIYNDEHYMDKKGKVYPMDVREKKFNEYEAKLNKSFDLMKKYFFNLWD